MHKSRSFLSHIRGVELLPGETVLAYLDPEDGTVDEPTPGGRLLAATDRRIISISEEGPTRMVQMFAPDTVTTVSVRNDARRGLSWKQWGALLAGGIGAYFILAYWLVDRVPLVVIPVVNMHAMAAVLMVLIVLLGWIIWRSLTDAGGSVLRIDGSNWSVEVPCTADNDELTVFAGIVLELRAETGARRQQSPLGEISPAGS